MTEQAVFSLWEPTQAYQAILKAWEYIKPRVMAHQRLELVLRPAKRSTEQNAKLHALLTEISEQVTWHGKRFDVTTWKRLCTAAWLREEKQQPEMIPALDGRGFDVIFERTSKMSVAEMSRLIEWTQAFAAEHGVSSDL